MEILPVVRASHSLHLAEDLSLFVLPTGCKGLQVSSCYRMAVLKWSGRSVFLPPSTSSSKRRSRKTSSKRRQLRSPFLLSLLEAEVLVWLLQLAADSKDMPVLVRDS